MNAAYERYLLRRETLGKPLLEAIRQAAARRGVQLPDVKESSSVGTDVKLLNRGGRVDVNRADDGSIDIAVWGYHLLAAGRTDDVESVVDLVSQFCAGGWAEVVAPPPFLTVFDTAGSAAEIEARWQWLLAYETSTGSEIIIQAVGAEPLLRAQCPITGGHTTLALVNRRGRDETHSMQFYPTSDKWLLIARRPSNSVESFGHPTRGLPLAEVVAAAVAEVAEHWPDAGESAAHQG
jgi:hypothetical protein